MTHKRSLTPYAKRRNKRRAVLLQARKKLDSVEFEKLRVAVERQQERDRRRSLSDSTFQTTQNLCDPPHNGVTPRGGPGE